MVQPNISRLGNENRGIVRLILQALRDFNIVHKKQINHTPSLMGQVDFGKATIYLRKVTGYEDDNTILHEIRHIFQLYYLHNPKQTEKEDELNADK